ncbi:MAG: preQ(1) synthase [Elusimicrobiota bacterium]
MRKIKMKNKISRPKFDKINIVKKFGGELSDKFNVAGFSNEANPKLLVAMDYEYVGKKIEVVVETDEFTCLCPWSGQPDFAKLTIIYVPGSLCVELKSLKLYLQSFRNVGIVHESVVNKILFDLVKIIKPKEMYVEATFNIRGGIKTTVKANYK